MIRRLAVPHVIGVSLLFALLLAAPAAAAPSPPAWKLTVTPNADYFLPGPVSNIETYGLYTIEAENVGGQATSGEVTIKDTLPAGLTPTLVRFYVSGVGNFGSGSTTGYEDLHETLCPSLLECRFPGSLASPHTLTPGKKLYMVVYSADPSYEGPLRDVATIAGGGALNPAEAAATNAASSNLPPVLLHFDSALTDSSANPYTQAGGHPYQFSTEFNFETYSAPVRSRETISEELGTPIPSSVHNIRTFHDVEHARAELPSGLLANPQGVPHCSLADYFSQECEEKKDQVGVACIQNSGDFQPPCTFVSPVFNLQPHGSYPGELGIPTARVPFIVITAGLRGASDYGVTATSSGPETTVSRVRVTLWGVPAAHAHDTARAKECSGQPGRRFLSVEAEEHRCEQEVQPGKGGPAEVEETPFLTMPTECSGNPLTVSGRYDTWQLPGVYGEASAESPAVDGCNQLSFHPRIEARPTTSLADAPSGLEFDLHVPQNEEVNEDATPELKEAVVKLPPGLTVNPSSGDGLQGCTEAQLGLHSEEPAACPDASKLGLVTVHTPLLHEPLEGALYLATPHQNPSNSLLAGYIVVEGQGVKVKLAGRFEPDPQTGQITAKFLQNPQLPFEDLEIKTFEGARGALRTPPTCGTYETTATLTPYSAPESGPAAEPRAEFETTSGPGGEGSFCPNGPSEEPNAPRFHAGTESPQAGAFSPFSLKLVRSDGEQEIKGIETTLPPGLVGKLAGVGECSDAQLAAASGKSGQAEQASPSCPATSEVGSVDVAAGAGPTPLNVAGHAYLSGPYKGAPLSLTIITPAVAGPFDLGTVVVRTALYVNPETAQITAKSDPIPTILEGIPLDVRSITLKMARPNFTLNPTNCEPLAITGSALSVFGSAAPLTQRFQVGGCPALPFKPSLKLKLKGATKRAQNPAFTAVLTAKPGEANIAKAQVTLPHSEFLDNAHIQTVCTRVQFAANQCPAASIYGHATAITPLLDQPLSGPVYLRSSSNKLPDLVAALNGQIEVDLDGKVDTGKSGGIRNTFEVVPDAPVTKFTLEMQGGSKGLLVNSENLCSPKTKTHATVNLTGQNGKTYNTTPAVANSCKKHGKAHKHGGKHHKSAHRVGTSHR